MLTVREVAKALRVCTATVYGLCEGGQLEYHRISGAIRISSAALASFIARSSTRPRRG